MRVLQTISAIVLPPLAVFLTLGLSPALFINIGLTLLGWVPGIIHAFWVVHKHYENIDRREAF